MSVTSVFPLEIQELRRPENTYRIDVRCFTSIKEIKDQLQREYNYPPSRIQLYHTNSSNSLRNQTTLHDLDIKQAGHTLRLALVFTTNPQYMLEPAKDMCLDEEVEEMIWQVRMGLRSGHLPAKTDMLDCTGGVYFMKGASNTPAAVFKPSDEEQGMPNNPKGYAGNGDYGLRSFFKPGEGHIRECAAYILDYQNFCHVPETAVVHLEHDAFHYPRNQKGQMNMYPKLGSLQRFVPAGDTFEDIGHSLVGVLELQKIALLDMRLLNCDRNASNMLAIRKPAMSREQKHGGPRKYSRSSSLGTASETCGSVDEMDLDEFLDGPFLTSSTFSTAGPGERGGGGSGSSKYSDSYKLVPIDHGYCLPSALHIDEYDWAWFYCPHVEVEVQPEIRDYMNNLDIELLLADLTSQLPVSADCLFLLRVTHALIKEGINAGLSLRDIASMIARMEEDVPSVLENAIAGAEENAQRTIESRAGRRQTTSPAFLKSMESAQATYLAQSAVSAAQQGSGVSGPCGTGGIAGSESHNSLLGADRDSPESPTIAAPVVVRQRSIGSPRSSGSSSPPQRIGGHKRIASTPGELMRGQSNAGGSSGGGGSGSGYKDSLGSPPLSGGGGSGHKGGRGAVLRTRSSSEEDEFPHTITTTSLGSAHKTPLVTTATSASTPSTTAPRSQGSGSGVYRPFPVRSTPDRVTRGISSELNLESLGSLGGGFGSPSFGSPNPLFNDGRATSYSLSSSSRSPLPLSAAERALYKPPRASLDASGSGSGAGSSNMALGLANPSLSVNIGYLSSENIQKHQASPSISAAKFPEFLFRDPVRVPSHHTSNVSGGDHAATPTSGVNVTSRTAPSPSQSNGDQFGDYFMKDLSLTVPNGVEDASSLPLHLVSSNSSCSSPHSAFVMLGSRERLSTPRTAASSSEKLTSKTLAAPLSAPIAGQGNIHSSSGNMAVSGGSLVRSNAASGTSLSSASSSSSIKNPYTSAGNSGSGGSVVGGVGVPVVRARPGDPIITMQSFDADYVRVHKHYGSGTGGAAGGGSAQGSSATGSAASSTRVSPVPSSASAAGSQPASSHSSRANLSHVDSLFSASTSASASASAGPVPGGPLTRVQVPVHSVRETSHTSQTSYSSGATSTSGLTASTGPPSCSSHPAYPSVSSSAPAYTSLPSIPTPVHFGGSGAGIGAALGGSLFASDSDLTASHSIATSFESAWSGSPKQQSPKLLGLGQADGFECAVRAGSALHQTQHVSGGGGMRHQQSALRDSESSNEHEGYLSDRSPRTINSGSLDNAEHGDLEIEEGGTETDIEGEQEHDLSSHGVHEVHHAHARLLHHHTHAPQLQVHHEEDCPHMLLVDGPMHTMPLKDMHDRTRLNMRTALAEEEGVAQSSEGCADCGFGSYELIDQPSPARPSIVPSARALSAVAAPSTTSTQLLHEQAAEQERDSLSLSRYSPTPSTLSTGTGVAAGPGTGTGMRPPGFHRVSSFAAFESPPLYSLPKNDRKGVRLKQEKRKAIALTQEFQDLRLSFCKESISSALLKFARSKAHN